MEAFLLIFNVPFGNALKRKHFASQNIPKLYVQIVGCMDLLETVNKLCR